MSARPTQSRFTPSLLPGETLERLFVARHRLLDDIVARIERASTSNERNHTLLVGRRGAGKTHLVALAHHRAQQMQADGARIGLAWLPEDPWTIVSYRHLLAAILDRATPAPAEPTPRDVATLEHHLFVHARTHGPIVVFAENLDTILAAMEAHGQQQLRHFLQTHRSLLFVASTTALDRTLVDEQLPFFDFFTISRLEPFGLDDAAEMLTRIAEERGDGAMAEYLDTEEGRSRLATVLHLAGGQPRMWATLASALTVDGLRELVDVLLTRFDDLTPYYQEQLGRLSPQQRLVVAELAEADHPLSVKELAERLELTERSVGKTMSELTDRSWVTTIDSIVTTKLDGRRSYYELSEPMARLSFQIKESRGEPLRLVVDFLKHWFQPSDFDGAKRLPEIDDYLIATIEGQSEDAVLAVTRRLRRLPAARVPTVELLARITDAMLAYLDDDPEPLLQLPTPVRIAAEEQLGDPRSAFAFQRQLHQWAKDEFDYVPHPAMAGWTERAERLARSAPDPELAGLAHLATADWLARCWHFADAHALIESAATSADGAEVIVALNSLATCYESAGRVNEAVTLFQHVLEHREAASGPDHPLTLDARHNLAHSYWLAGRTSEALSLQRQVVADSERVLGPDHVHTLASQNGLAAAYTAVGRIEDAIALQHQVLAAREHLLGPNHPHTLTTRNNLASSYRSAGRTSEAIALQEHVLIDSARVLGSDHTLTLTARNNLAISYRSVDRMDEAIDLQGQVLTDSERILGPDHPDTVAARWALAAWQAEANEG